MSSCELCHGVTSKGFLWSPFKSSTVPLRVLAPSSKLSQSWPWLQRGMQKNIQLRQGRSGDLQVASSRDGGEKLVSKLRPGRVMMRLDRFLVGKRHSRLENSKFQDHESWFNGFICLRNAKNMFDFLARQSITTGNIVIIFWGMKKQRICSMTMLEQASQQVWGGQVALVMENSLAHTNCLSFCFSQLKKVVKPFNCQAS